MKKVAIVIGHDGAKHSSVIAAAKMGKGYRVVTLGDVMLGIAKKKRLANSIAQMRRLPADQNNDIRTEAVNKIAAMEGNVVLETHGGAEQHGRIFPGLSHYLTKHLKHAVGFFYIDTNNNQALKRVNLAILSYNADNLNLPLHVITLKEGSDDAKRQLIDDLNDTFGA